MSLLEDIREGLSEKGESVGMEELEERGEVAAVPEESSTVITYTDYHKYKADLDAELQKSAEGFVKIGYLLKVARDTGILKDSGYANVNEFAQKEYGLDKTQVSRFMNINDKFSQDGYSGKLKEEYRGYGYAKLSIMLLLPEEVNEMLTPDLSKSEIQAVREEIAEEQKVTDIELMIEGEDAAQQALDNNLDKALHQLGHDAPILYMALYDAMGDGLEAVKEVLMPAGYKMYSIRLQGVGRLMLSVSAEKGVSLLAIRDNAKEVYTWEQLMDGLRYIMLPDRTAKESWEEYYDEDFPEEEERVAPVQQAAPRKESKVVKAKLPEKSDTKPQTESTAEQTTEEIAVQQAQETNGQQAEKTTGQQAQETNVPQAEEAAVQQAQEEKTDAEDIGQSGTVDQTGDMESKDASENLESEAESAETMEDAEEVAAEAGNAGVEGRRSAKVAELEAKVHYWKGSLETHEIALRNRISMETWEKVAELAKTIKEEAEKIVNLKGEIKEINEHIQMRIEDIENAESTEEQDEEEDGEEPEIPVR